MQFLRTDPVARPLYQLRPGRPVRVAVDADGGLLALRFHTSAGEMLAIERGGESAFHAQRTAATEDVRTTLRTGEIRSSLFGAADSAGIPDAVTIALADVFAGDIDFYHDLRRGDRFGVVYEERFVDGEPVGTGRILAAEFENRGAVLRVFLWRDPEGNEGYFTESGRSARGAFLKSPMEFSRITSGFTLARFHPILQQWRAHQGVDYAAPTGTPVRATADGVVAFAGRQGGYGNVIFVRHQGTYSTVYGHLSRFAPAVKDGARVRQGDTIGYVGMTGWATGPHLHYEFRIADEARNPLAITLPIAQTIAPERIPQYKAAIVPLAESLALARALPGSAFAATE
jgi:murein DD-endopeptidase MepM/ murein hydrolase activator NlpD